jgi:hypothetical protein
VPRTPLGRVGRIAHANDQSEIGCFVEIVDDSRGPTGGAYIVTWSADSKRGGDGWVIDVADIDTYMAEAGWTVDWLDDVPPEAAAGRPRHT